MKKQLFKNYNFEFDSNEKKVLKNFCKQAIGQMTDDDRFIREVNVFNSLQNKLSSNEEIIKLTKEEKTKLVLQLKENAKYLKDKMNKSWFIKKWFFNSVYKQYNSILIKHFSE